MAAWQKGFSFCATKCFISASVAQKDRALDRPRRRQKASGRVVTCLEGWIALKRKPRNMALFALWRIWLICKIEAGLGRQNVQCYVVGLMAWPHLCVAKCLVFQWLSSFFVSSENNLKKVLDGWVGERYTWCIEGQESQAAQLLASATKQ